LIFLGEGNLWLHGVLAVQKRICMSQKFVFITGASTGIGLATAQQLDAHGWRVFAGVLPSEDTSALKSRASDKLTIVPIDITNSAMIQNAAESISKAVGDSGLAGLVNNAGIAITGPLEFLPLDALRQQLEVNLIGHVAVTQAFLPLIRQARGRIVNTISILGRVVTPFGVSYSMSKFALEAFTDGLRLELSPWGIEVIGIEPGFIATPIWKKTAATTDEILQELPPQGRELYGEMLAAVSANMAQSEQRGSPPEVVALAIIEALTAAKPKTRYQPGRDGKRIITLRWLLPDRVMDWLIKRRYKLR
jgi:NAD(P)-dependent dehydrogenase (short-subunit alcohol dehydrogenase family)